VSCFLRQHSTQARAIRYAARIFSRTPDDHTPMFVHVPAENVQGNEQGTLGIAARGHRTGVGATWYMATADGRSLRHLCRHSFASSTMGFHGGASRGGGPRRRHKLSVDLRPKSYVRWPATTGSSDALDLLV